MGQYYLTINLDKKQFIHPHKFGDGLKLLEFACSGAGTMAALAILLADGNGRGSGDLHADEVEHPIIGSWAGDRIVVAGDYADPDTFGVTTAREGHPDDIRNDVDYGDHRNLYDVASDEYEDISAKVIQAMAADSYMKETLAECLGSRSYYDSYTVAEADMISIALGVSVKCTPAA